SGPNASCLSPSASRSQRSSSCRTVRRRLRGRMPSYQGVGERGAGDGERIAVRRKERARGLDDLLLRHGTQLARVALEVILAEVEHLRLEHHRSDAGRALERNIELAHELVLRDGQ